jgi:hypothetical protein
MAKKPKPKRAKDLTTDEALDRLFGKQGAKRLRELAVELDRKKGRKTG